MQLHTGAVGYMDKLLLSLQQRLIGDLKRFVERFSFIGINAALAAFDFCQSTAGQIAACKLCFCRKLFLRQCALFSERSDILCKLILHLLRFPPFFGGIFALRP